MVLRGVFDLSLRLGILSQPDADSASIDAVCAKGREAILVITDRILELVPPRTTPNVEETAQIERLLNRLTWYLGFWKSYGTNDTAERIQAALDLISPITISVTDAVGDPKWWKSIRFELIHYFQTINGMALLVDRGRMNPLLVREIYAQVEADLKAFKVQFGAKAAR
jgi:hypothetical protein